MATRYDPTVTSLPVTGFPRPSAAPVSRTMTPAVGGGTSAVVPAMDPRSLVPVNRAQPVATDGYGTRRTMEARSGYSPPSSFAGAGAAYSPATSLPPTVVNPEPRPMYSPEAMQAIDNQLMYASSFADPGAAGQDGIYYATGTSPNPEQIAADARAAHVSRRGDVEDAANRQKANRERVNPGVRMMERLAGLQDRMSPERYAAMMARFQEVADRWDARMANPAGPGAVPVDPLAPVAPPPLTTILPGAPANIPAPVIPAIPTSPADRARQYLAGRSARNTGLLGI